MNNISEMTAMELHRLGEEMAAKAVKKFFPGRLKHSVSNELYIIYRNGMDIAHILLDFILDTGRAKEIIKNEGMVILLLEQMTRSTYQIYKDQAPEKYRNTDQLKEFWNDSVVSGFIQVENELRWYSNKKENKQTA